MHVESCAILDGEEPDSMRITCPVCGESLGYIQHTVEYGYIQEDGKFFVLEWTETDWNVDEITIVCYTKDCAFALADFAKLAKRIASDIG